MYLCVVYLLIPTSNHNPTPPLWFTKALYIFWFLHQTTTHELSYTFDRKLYIFWFLHQTTTEGRARTLKYRCISFDSYIKPQQCHIIEIEILVVYLLIPTSNHNLVAFVLEEVLVVYLLIPTSNHNPSYEVPSHIGLYIFWFLHQTTTLKMNIY